MTSKAGFIQKPTVDRVMQSLTMIVGEDGKTLFEDVYAQLAMTMPNVQTAKS
jgi:hypothetical protein